MEFGNRSDKTDDIYKNVMELIPQTDDLRIFLQKVYLLFNMPVIVTDIAFHLIAYGGPYPCPDPLWQKIISSGSADPETVLTYYFGEGFFNKMYAAGQPIDASWGINTDYPQTTCSVYLDNTIEGCCSVMYLDPNKLNLALKINAATKTAIEIFLSGKTYQQPAGTVPDRLVAARILLERTDTPISLITGTSFYKTIGLTPGYLIVALRIDEISQPKLRNIICNIRLRYPGMLYVNKGSDVYILFQKVTSTAGRRKILEDIKHEAMEKVTFTGGASDIFRDLNRHNDFLEQAELSISYAAMSKSTNIICSYYEHFSDIVLLYGYKNIAPQNLMLPELQKVVDYDVERSTNYFESLKCFIYEHGDMTKAAEKLFIHRNSLMYRIKKCEELMGVDINEPEIYEDLWLCCKLQEKLVSSR